MATSDPVRLLQEEVTCAICLDYLHEPVTIDCGHNFCRACITRCWDEMGRRFPCPQCRARSPKRKLRPNCQLANVATAAKRLRPGMSLPQSPCPQHPGEDLWLFCRRDGATLCPACHHERAHRGHDLVVLDEEGQATRARLRGVLGSLRAQRKALEDAGTRQELQGAHLDEEAAIRRQRLGDEFEGLRHFLSKAEQDLLSSLAAAEHQAQAARRARGARLSANAQQLDRLLLEASRQRKGYWPLQVAFIKHFLCACQVLMP
uniref:Uncharacterized protein n=1 Tax=Vombatus ursinus TaxID=29139 RepID=A0A4X2KYG7_VOMUR